MPRVWVSLGSNQERERSLGIAVAALRAHYGELRLSPVYESAAQGFSGEPFLNLVAGFETTEDVEEVRRRLRAIEDAAGRVRRSASAASQSCTSARVSSGTCAWSSPLSALPSASASRSGR